MAMANMQMGIDPALDVLAGILRNGNVPSALALLAQLKPQIVAYFEELESLRKSSRRIFHADGSFDLLESAEEVIRRRIEAAGQQADMLAACKSVLEVWDSKEPLSKLHAAIARAESRDLGAPEPQP